MITIRKASIEDRVAVATLFEQYRIWYRMSPDQDQANQFIADRLEKGDSYIYVAQSDSKLVGFVQLYPQWSSVSMRQYLLLNDLFVHKDYRDHGIGKQLIDQAKELVISKGLKGLLLETEQSNDVGNHLYPKQGFTAETNNFYFWMNPS